MAAHLTDLLALLLALFLVAIIMRALRGVGVFHQPANLRYSWDELGVAGKLAGFIAFYVSLGALYVPLCHASPAQATVGKWMTKTYVARHDGSRLSLERAFCRWFVQTTFGLFGIGFISGITIVTDPKRRAVHDFAVGTIVALGTPPSRLPLEWWRVAAGLGVQVLCLVITFLFIFIFGFEVQLRASDTSCLVVGFASLAHQLER